MLYKILKRVFQKEKIFIYESKNAFYYLKKNNSLAMMEESSLSIPVYDGSLLSVRTASSTMTRLQPTTGLARR